jgi:hypothetical protein
MASAAAGTFWMKFHYQQNRSLALQPNAGASGGAEWKMRATKPWRGAVSC